ncbi:MAG: hypothetical protein KatS3mg101_0806 [Patescibacteria group bacterium]|nr:MAG: hypothetical protein KatS3mg101_0806 [Patescibacteria group bacterium]
MSEEDITTKGYSYIPSRFIMEMENEEKKLNALKAAIIAGYDLIKSREILTFRELAKVTAEAAKKSWYSSFPKIGD